MKLKRIAAWLALLCLLSTALPALGPGARASANYMIAVDITNQIVTVYKSGNTSESGIVRQMICSTGKSGSATPTGTYALPSKRYSTERREWYYFPKYNCYAKWATRIVGGILFHSVLYTASKAGPTRSSVNALGSRASHGCVRLRVEDARWIAQNCPAGTLCRIYYSGKTNAALRRLLLQRSFSADRESYAGFMGRDRDDPGAVLSRGSRGERVARLQTRLKALGFLDDVADGAFGSRTQTAVKRFQAAAGLEQTGRVDDALWKGIFSDNAPTGTWVTLVRGMSGPAVRTLQQALADLKLYTIAVDGSFGGGTAQAVRDFQEFFGYAVDGKATPTIQNDILRQAAEVRGRFGGDDYRLVKSDRRVSMARLKRAAKLYARARTSSKKLASLKKKAEVEVLSRVGGWSRVRCNGRIGYLQNKYLTFFTAARTEISYEATEPEAPAPTPTPPPEVFIPTPTPEVFIPTPTPEIFIPTPGPAT